MSSHSRGRRDCTSGRPKPLRIGGRYKCLRLNDVRVTSLHSVVYTDPCKFLTSLDLYVNVLIIGNLRDENCRKLLKISRKFAPKHKKRGEGVCQISVVGVFTSPSPQRMIAPITKLTLGAKVCPTGPLISVILAFLLLPTIAAAQGTPAGSIYGYVLDPHALPPARRAHCGRRPQHRRNSRHLYKSAGLLFLACAPARPLQPSGRGQRIRNRPPDRDGTEANQQARLDVTLKVGGTTESITVEGSAPLLNTSDATGEHAHRQPFRENMPLNGRSFSGSSTSRPAWFSQTTSLSRVSLV